MTCDLGWLVYPRVARMALSNPSGSLTVSDPSIGAPRLRARQRFALALEILSAYLLVRRTSRELKLPGAVARLRSADGGRPRPLPAGVDGVRLGRAVTRTLMPLPGGTRCLVRSLVLMRLLAHRGVHGDLVIAVLPGESQLDAHAWIELDGRPLLPPLDTHGRLLVL